MIRAVASAAAHDVSAMHLATALSRSCTSSATSSEASSSGTSRVSRPSGRRVGAGLHADLARVLVCPLSKRPLRYDPVKQELVNDELGVAWPVVDGVPQLIPQRGRMLEADEADESRLGHRDLLLH